MQKNLLNGLIISMLALTVAGCTGNKNNSQDADASNGQHTESATPLPEPEDDTNLIPTEVQNYVGDIDFFVYIEGNANTRTFPDIGSSSVTPAEIDQIELVKYVGAARAFKKVSPGTKINLIYCDINQYNSSLNNYYEINHHYPHLMWATDHVVEMMQQGYYADLSEYEDTEYYQSFNQYFMTRFNFGGFQGAIPVAAEPWGVFVNLDTLDEYNVVNTSDETAYQEWVDNLTMDNFIQAVKDTTDDTHAGLSKVVEYFTSYGNPEINKQFLSDGTVAINTEAVQAALYDEQELSQYCVYDYSAGEPVGAVVKEAFTGKAAPWWGTQNFVEDEFSTFYAEAPWALPTIAQYAKAHNLERRVDFLPYPKMDESSEAYTGIAVEGVGVAELCPININGEKECYSSNAELEKEVAAYFAMFMAADSRSMEARSKVDFIYNDAPYTGSVSLPLIKKDFNYTWQEENDGTIEDPASEYDSNFEYQMALWFGVYDLYKTDDEPLDTKEFSNVTYGLTRMFDSIYGDNVTCLNFWNEPVNVQDGADIVDIFEEWQGRFKNQALGTDNYVSDVLALLGEWETKINDRSETAWQLIQEMLDNFYGEGKYDVLDRTNRNDF